MKNNFTLIFFVISSFCFAQQPNTDLWLFQLQIKNDSVVIAKNAANITNREGYDNQPSFSSDGKSIYFVSIKEDKQADIYRYTIKNKKIIQVTKTKESEYSPREIANTKLLSSVVVLQDSSQVIMPISASDGSYSAYTSRLSKKEDTQLQATDSVGYYCFLNSDTVVYYKLTEPHSLRYFSITTKKDALLGTHPTRCFWAINRHMLIYGIKDSSSTTFYKYNFILRKAEVYASYPRTSEDFIWHNTLGLIKSEGQVLLRYNEKKQSWVTFLDLKNFKLNKITRFAINNKNNYLVLVDNL